MIPTIAMAKYLHGIASLQDNEKDVYLLNIKKKQREERRKNTTEQRVDGCGGQVMCQRDCFRPTNRSMDHKMLTV